MTKLRLDIFTIINFLFMMVLCLLFLYPLVYTISISLSDASSILGGKVILYPIGFNIDAYKALIQDKSLMISFFFTIKLTILGVAASIGMTVFTAYPLSVGELKGKRYIFHAIIFTMYFSGGIIPTYLLVKGLGLINTMGALIWTNVIDTFLLIIMISYFRGLSEELKEAARIDGCSNFNILIKIIIPLSMPVIATLTIYYAVNYWNTFFNALLYIQDPNKYTLQIKLFQVLDVFSGDVGQRASSIRVTSENLKGATIILAAFPILVVYPFLQKYFEKGITVGALKG